MYNIHISPTVDDIPPISDISSTLQKILLKSYLRIENIENLEGSCHDIFYTLKTIT